MAAKEHACFLWGCEIFVMAFHSHFHDVKGEMPAVALFTGEGDGPHFLDKMFMGVRGLCIGCKYWLWVYEITPRKHCVCLSAAL